MKTALILTSVLAVLAIGAQAAISIANLTATGATNADGSNVTFTATITEDTVTNGDATLMIYINSTNGLTGFSVGPQSIAFDPVGDGSGVCYWTNTSWNPYFTGDFFAMPVVTPTNGSGDARDTMTVTVNRIIGGTLNSMQVPVDTNAAYDAHMVFTNVCVTQVYLFNGGIDVWLNDSGVQSAIWIGCNLVNADPIWTPEMTYEQGQIAFLDTGVYRPYGTPFRFDMNLHARPTTMLVFGDIKRFIWTPASASAPNGPGNLVLDLTSSNPWRNDFSTNFQASVGFTPLFATDTNVTEEMENMVLCTSAFYSDVMPVINTNGIGVKVNGRTNSTSYLKAFVPDTLLAKWGVPVDKAMEVLAGYTTHFNAAGESEEDTTTTTLAFNRIIGGTNIVYAWNSSTNGDSGYEARFDFTFHSPVEAQIGVMAESTATLSLLADDFDGDRKADPAVYVITNGLWYLKLSAINYSLVTLNFGGTAYSACVGDYDGDGKADPAVYQESTGNWSVQLSASGYAIATMEGFGGLGFQAVAADYDGDGRADPAIYNTTSGVWQVAMSSLGYGLASLTGFGGNGYTAVQENYDTDNRADAAVFNTTNGNWTILFSASSYITDTLWGFGGTGYDPVSGDFDGDGRADPTIYQESTGTWQVKLSGSGYATASLVGFGGTRYTVGAADFDGDGKADPVLLDTLTGMWHIKLSASGYAEATLASGYTP